MLRLYNTYSNKLETFKPIKKGEVGMYTCGPTVYDYIHLGNARTFLIEDLLRRYLEYSGYKIKQVMNITDVGHLTQDEIESGEDKLDVAAKKKKKTPKEIASFYEKDFFEQIKKLNFKKAYKYPRATDHIKEMQDWIKKLLKNGFAYEVNGSVYFDISSFKKYGKLSGNTLNKLKEGKSGRKLDNTDKKNFYDFALWINDPKHLMSWPSPWCKNGYPGWHLECSVMATKYLGKQFDIHMGGEDNIFPHHEAEIAQAEGVTRKKWVNYWIHPRHLMVDSGKMSKRDGNFYTPEDIYKRGYSPRQLRFFLVSAHYRKKLNFTFDALEASNKSLQKLITFIDDLKNASGRSAKDYKKLDLDAALSNLRVKFVIAMNSDLNISGALAEIFTFVTKINKHMRAGYISKADAKKIITQLKKFDKVFGVLFWKDNSEISAEVNKLIQQRDEARKNKDWDASDKIRDELKARGIELKDVDGKTKIVIKFNLK
jgi:cysteinyl-tRNA synthetase